MERQLYEKIMIKNHKGEIISQFFCEHGLSYKEVRNYEGTLREVKLEVNGKYVGAVECYGGSIQSRLYYWTENCDLVFVREEGEE